MQIEARDIILVSHGKDIDGHYITFRIESTRYTYLANKKDINKAIQLSKYSDAKALNHIKGRAIRMDKSYV